MPDVNPSETQVSEHDLVKKFARDEIGLSDLPPSLRKQLLDGTYRPEAEPAPEAKPSEPEPSPEAESSEVGQAPESAPSEPTETPESKPSKKEKRKPLTLEEARQAALDRANQLNTWEQRQKAHLHKMQNDPVYRSKWFQDNNIPVPVEPAKAKPDIWSDDFHQQQAKMLAETQAELQAIKAEKEMQKIYRQVENFARGKGFELQSSVEEIDNAARLLESSGLKGEAQEAELVRIGFDAEDVKVYGTLVKVQQHQVAEGLKDMDLAWYDWQRLNGGVPAPRKKASVDDTDLADRERRARKMEEVLSHPTTLPNQRAMSADQGLTPEYAMKWLDAHPDTALYSEEDNKVWARIKTLMGIR